MEVLSVNNAIADTVLSTAAKAVFFSWAATATASEAALYQHRVTETKKDGVCCVARRMDDDEKNKVRILLMDRQTGPTA